MSRMPDAFRRVDGWAMSKKQFVEQYGATCPNWRDAWSYVNTTKRFVIFCAWEDFTTGFEATILETSWRKYTGKVARGYAPAIEHMRLVEEKGYGLFIFRARKRQETSKTGAVGTLDFQPELIPAKVHREGDAWIATFMHAPWQHRDVQPSLRVSVSKLKSCLEGFRARILEADGKPFESFSTGTPGDEEGYKAILAAIARQRLAIGNWKVDQVGDGTIWDRVVSAIQVKEDSSSNTPENNLVSWQRFGLPGSLDELANKPDKLFRVESLLFDFYKDELEAPEAFDGLVEELGRQYPLMAYLFFIKDPDRYLPIAPQTFDEFFSSIGVNLQTNLRCSWENYRQYLEVISQVRDFLREEQSDNISLLDAHSFCWMVARQHLQPESTSILPVLRRPTPADSEPATSKRSREPDWLALHKARMLLGKQGEEIAYEAEQNRLKAEGHPELAEKVSIISDDHTYGFDIFSYETDGSQRLIEVKATRDTSETVNFSTSWRQWEMAQSEENYYYYLVRIPKQGEPSVTMIRGSEIPKDSAEPVVYSVSVKLQE